MEWGFIARILEAWSLCEELKLLIMNWLNLVIFEILINGNISGSMEPRRGIRQGDPLNIFFSILCAKIFFLACSAGKWLIISWWELKFLKRPR